MKSSIGALVVVLLLTSRVCRSRSADKDLAATVKLLQEQMSALLDHRQQDYNALEESLRRSIDKNTEISVLKNELQQIR